MDVPKTREELLKEIELKNGLKLVLSLPRLGIFKSLKRGLVDFRHVLNDIYRKNNVFFTNE